MNSILLTLSGADDAICVIHELHSDGPSPVSQPVTLSYPLPFVCVISVFYILEKFKYKYAFYVVYH